MIAVQLGPEDEARLERLAADRGETIEQIARRFVLDRLHEEGWSELSDDDWAKSCESMAAKSLPPEDWSDADDEGPADGSR